MALPLFFIPFSHPSHFPPIPSPSFSFHPIGTNQPQPPQFGPNIGLGSQSPPNDWVEPPTPPLVLIRHPCRLRSPSEAGENPGPPGRRDLANTSPITFWPRGDNAIPFSLIPHDFFIKQIIPTGILTVEEISAMLMHYCGDADPLPFSAQPRVRFQGQGHNKLVDKNVVEIEKADLLAEIDHLKKAKAKCENEKTKSEETIQQLKMEKAISEEKIKQLEKNVPKVNPVCETVEKKKGMWRTIIQKK